MGIQPSVDSHGRADGRVAGVLLAAGAGSRMGLPKALVRDPKNREPWLHSTIAALREAGCGWVHVVAGCRADEVAELAALSGEQVTVVTTADWAEGMSRSLVAGLESLDPALVDVAVVMLVDLPDVRAEVIARVLAGADLGPDCLVRASFHGAPGHPVLLGSRHWAGVIEAAAGDRGARDYLRRATVQLIECADLASGADQDRPLNAAD